MTEETIGKIVVTVAVGAPTAWFVGRIFYDVLRHKIYSWGHGAGYIQAISDMRELGKLKEEDE